MAREVHVYLAMKHSVAVANRDAAAEVATEQGRAMHVFEVAGLGVGPFRFVGSEVSLYQAVPGDPSCPVKPGSSCDYCGTAIALVCWIQDSRGNRFKVGSDCVRRTGDAGLVRHADAAQAAHDRARRAARSLATRASVESALADQASRERLAALPHPKGWAGKTLLDWADWMLANAGDRGRREVARAIARAL